MKIQFSYLSLRTKTLLLIGGINLCAIIIASILFITFDKSEFQNKAVRDLTIITKLYKTVNTPWLMFMGHSEEESKIFSNYLSVEEAIEVMQIFKGRDKLFTEYVTNKNYRIDPRIFPKNDTVIVEGNKIRIYMYMMNDFQEIEGRIFCQADISKEYKERKNRIIYSISIIITVFFAFIALLTLSVQRIITNPILHLAELMHRISDTKDYSIRNVKISADEIGVLAMGFNEMLSQIEKQNHDLQVAKDHAEYSLKVKEQFLANMSHEIRTPMNAIIGMTSLALDTELTQDQQTYLQNIQSSADYLLVIINDILDFSKIEAGKIELEMTEFNLFDMVYNFRNTIKYTADRKGLYLNIKIAPDVPTKITGDQVRLNQIILNLVGNAIKFTEHGGVTLDITKIEETQNIINLLFTVTDTGIGIPVDKQETIFASFSQASSSTTRKYGGTGLGLTISKQLVELQCGKIWVESEVGKGSSFKFNLPFKKVVLKPTDIYKNLKIQKEIKAADVNFTHKLRVLLAEDNPVNQLLASTILKKKNIEVEVAETGLQVIEKLKIAHFDVILMDLHMPEMDGYDATLYIRSNFEGSKKNIPIIALTAAATTKEVEKCFAIGMTDFISKPFKAEELFEKITTQIILHSKMDILTKHTDLTYLETMSEGNKDFVKQLIFMFFDQVPEFIEKMKDALSKNDLKALEKVVHLSRTSLSIMGMEDLSNTARYFEELIQKGESTGSYPELVADFEKVCNEAVLELKGKLEKLG